jgi:putative ABC transport system permease protein
MLTHRLSRLVLSILGIAFAVLLMFMQLGFLTGLFDNQTMAIRLFDADIVITSSARNNLHIEQPFPEIRVRQARDIPGVASTVPLWFENGIWKNPTNGKENVMRIIGIDPDDPGFTIEEVVDQASLLREPDSALFDRASRQFFEQVQTGEYTELNRRRMHVVGTFYMGADFKNDGTAIVGNDTFHRLYPYTYGMADVGIVRLKPGADREQVLRQLKDALPPDVQVQTQAEYEKMERDFWSRMTPTGFVFTLGLVVGFVIGVMICYQILYNEINDHLPQFATLKAMGFHDRYLMSVVFKEAILLAIMGLIPGVIASGIFYAIMKEVSGLHMELTVLRVVLIGSLTIVMCIFSGMLAISRILKADPAEMFG